MKELFSRFYRHPVITLQLLISSLVIALLGLATSIFVIQVLNRFITHGVNSTLLSLVIGTLIAVLFEFAFRALRRRLIVSQNAEENHRLSKFAVLAMLQVQQPVLERISPGQRYELLRGVDAIRAVTMPQTVAAVLDLPFALLFVVALWLLSPTLALVTAVAMIVLLLVALFVQISTRGRARQVQEFSAERAGVLGSVVDAAETVRLFNGASFLSEGWNQSDRWLNQLRIRLGRLRDGLQSRAGMISSLQTVAIVSLGALQVVEGELSVGALIGANILAGRALMPVNRLSQMGESFAVAKQAGERLRELMQLPTERQEGSALKRYSGTIELKDLAFHYPGNPVLLFESLSLQLKAGQVVVVAGPNGSGKSTLARLLMGVMEPVRGQILAEGLEMRQVALPWWRMQVGYLPQEPLFVTGTIEENIKLANPELSGEGLNEVVRLSGLRPFLDASSEGIAMLIREGGRQLSLGIRKRLALARALATGGKLFIADEPTEGLDDEGRQALAAVISHLRQQGVTMVVISHDKAFESIADYRLDLGVKPVPLIQARQVRGEQSGA